MAAEDPGIQPLLEELRDLRVEMRADGGLAIVKTLNRHTQILERIDRRLAAPGNGRRGR